MLTHNIECISNSLELSLTISCSKLFPKCSTKVDTVAKHWAIEMEFQSKPISLSIPNQQVELLCCRTQLKPRRSLFWCNPNLQVPIIIGRCLYNNNSYSISMLYSKGNLLKNNTKLTLSNTCSNKSPYRARDVQALRIMGLGLSHTISSQKQSINSSKILRRSRFLRQQMWPLPSKFNNNSRLDPRSRQLLVLRYLPRLMQGISRSSSFPLPVVLQQFLRWCSTRSNNHPHSKSCLHMSIITIGRIQTSWNSRFLRPRLQPWRSPWETPPGRTQPLTLNRPSHLFPLGSISLRLCIIRKRNQSLRPPGNQIRGSKTLRQLPRRGPLRQLPQMSRLTSSKTSLPTLSPCPKTVALQLLEVHPSLLKRWPQE